VGHSARSLSRRRALSCSPDQSLMFQSVPRHPQSSPLAAAGLAAGLAGAAGLATAGFAATIASGSSFSSSRSKGLLDAMVSNYQRSKLCRCCGGDVVLSAFRSRPLMKLLGFIVRSSSDTRESIIP